MPQLQDCKHAYFIANTTATSGTVPDLELLWLQTQGATSNVTQDAWDEYFDSLGVAAGNYQDRAFAWLGSMGHTQNVLKEREFAFYCSVFDSPAGLWILADGTWNDDGIWIDTETWNDTDPNP